VSSPSSPAPALFVSASLPAAPLPLAGVFSGFGALDDLDPADGLAGF